jgi:hypothetical protein
MTTRCFTALAGAFVLLVLSLTAAGAADTAGPRAGEEINEGCAGIIATGTCVKGGRSIFWKQRHVAEAEGNKPYFFSGPVYDYTGIGSEANSTSRMGMNEAGLALGTFTASSPAMSEANRQYVSDMSMTTTEVCQHALGNFSTVAEAALFIAEHIDLDLAFGNNIGIVSAEPGVGAVVSACNVAGIVYGHITWVNDSWAPIDNGLHCEGICLDPDGNGQTIYDIWTAITTPGNGVTSSDGDCLITWEDVCHLGAKNVSDKELGEGTFSSLGEISRPISVAAFVAVSGDTSFGGTLNTAWLQIGRQAIVGTFLPLSPVCLTSSADIPAVFLEGDGIEDYVDPKREYAGEGLDQGLFYCDRVQEIQHYANYNETYLLAKHEALLRSITPAHTPDDIKVLMSQFVGDWVDSVLAGYVAEQRIGSPGNRFTEVTTVVTGDRGAGQGVVWGDFWGDGDDDLYIVNENRPNRLLRNDGGIFVDVSRPPVDDAGPGMGVSACDYDNDGDLDLYVVNEGSENRLLRNDGGGDFASIESSPVNDPGPGRHGIWADIDSDGDVDLFLCQWGSANRLFRNDGPAGFADATPSVLADAGNTAAACWGDCDDDGDPDLYVANWNGANHLVRNDGGGEFTDVTCAPLDDGGTATSASWADTDNDGDLDLHFGKSQEENRLFRNDGGLLFTDVTTHSLGRAGEAEESSWCDYDADGDLDVYAAYWGEANALLENLGHEMFIDAAVAAVADTGHGTGTAWADYDADGDLDLYLCVENGENRLLRNDGEGGHWLHLDLIGVASNRSAIGARVRAVAGDRIVTREVSGGEGRGSQSSLTVELGLGTATGVDSLVVRWPCGLVQSIPGLPADVRLTITEGEAPTIAASLSEPTAPAFCLASAHPNPFAHTTTIRYHVHRYGFVRLGIYDVAGRLVCVLDASVRPRGWRSVEWDGRDSASKRLAAGVYFLRLEAGERSASGKVLLLR